MENVKEQRVFLNAQKTSQNALCGFLLPPGFDLVAGPTQVWAWNKAKGVALPLEALAERCTFGEVCKRCDL